MKLWNITSNHVWIKSLQSAKLSLLNISWTLSNVSACLTLRYLMTWHFCVTRQYYVTSCHLTSSFLCCRNMSKTMSNFQSGSSNIHGGMVDYWIDVLAGSRKAKWVLNYLSFKTFKIVNAPLRSNICTFLPFDFNIRRMQRPGGFVSHHRCKLRFSIP